MISHLSKQADVPQIRTFIAVELPEPLKRELAQVQTKFSQHSSSVKWVSADLIHITVRFLGGISRTTLDRVAEAASSAASSVSPFSLQLSELGAFPNERSPRVLWVGLKQDAGVHELQTLSLRLEEELESLGFEREKRGFSPHITIGRVRDNVEPSGRRRVGASLATAKRAIGLKGRFEVTDLVVMQSKLSPSGPRYTPLERALIGASARRESTETGG